MAASIPISEQRYLSSIFEPDAEFVDSEIRERHVGTYDQGDWQQAIQRYFADHAKPWNVRSIPELRIRIREGKYRIPDVTVLDRAGEKEQVVTRSPLAVFEVLSPDDLAAELFEKLEDYSSIRIRDVWVVDPKTETFRRYIEGCLEPALLFESPERGIVFEMSEIRAYLQD